MVSASKFLSGGAPNQRSGPNCPGAAIRLGNNHDTAIANPFGDLPFLGNIENFSQTRSATSVNLGDSPGNL